MGHTGSRAGGWTAELVERWLVAAFTALPGAHVFTRDGILRSDSLNPGYLAILNSWRDLLADDPDGRDSLWAWASCKATKRHSFGEHCRLRGWNRATADLRRRRAAERIAMVENQADTTE